MLRLLRWLTWPALLLLLACSSRATPEDEAALARARRVFGQRFLIEPRQDLYIEARYRLGGCPREEEAIPLYEALLMEPSLDSRRTDSSFVYLDLSNDEGEFCFQLFYDPNTGRIERSEQPYY